jgi:hypothetical protein
MKKITKYLANDGTEFEFEDECLDYELKAKVREIYGFTVYDCDGKEIKPDDYRDLDCFIGEARYIKITDVKGWDEFSELCEENDVYFYDGMDDFYEKGLYYFDDDHDYWLNWDSEYEKLRTIRRKMDY